MRMDVGACLEFEPSSPLLLLLLSDHLPLPPAWGPRPFLVGEAQTISSWEVHINGAWGSLQVWGDRRQVKNPLPSSPSPSHLHH